MQKKIVGPTDPKTREAIALKELGEVLERRRCSMVPQLVPTRASRLRRWLVFKLIGTHFDGRCLVQAREISPTEGKAAR